MLPLERVIAVDVDGTLDLQGALNAPLVAWLQERWHAGFSLMLWSARGKAHAAATAERHGLTAMFDVICSKPGFLVDDRGWNWIKFTGVVKRLDAATVEQMHRLAGMPPPATGD